MPYPTKSEKEKGNKGKSEYMKRCMHVMKQEGKDHPRAVAQCLNMWKQGSKRKKAKGNTDPLTWEEHEKNDIIATPPDII